MSFREELHQRARAVQGTVVLAEGGDSRVRAAADRLEKDETARVVVLDGPIGQHAHLEAVADHLRRKRADRVQSAAEAFELAREPIRFAAGLVALGHATAAVAGAVAPTADVIRAALWLIGPAPGVNTISSCFYMVFDESPVSRVLSFTDCAVVPEPDAEQLAGIAAAAADDRARIVGDQPVVAFLSYSTRGSAEGPRVEKVQLALKRFRQIRPGVPADGELQGDAALVPEVAERKAPGSPVAGRANVLVFPDLDSGNLAYKLVQRLAGAAAIGPVLQGLSKPMADLSRGAKAEDIVDVAAAALLQSVTGEK